MCCRGHAGSGRDRGRVCVGSGGDRGRECVVEGCWFRGWQRWGVCCRGCVGSGGDRGGVCVVGGVLVQGVTEVGCVL